MVAQGGRRWLGVGVSFSFLGSGLPPDRSEPGQICLLQVPVRGQVQRRRFVMVDGFRRGRKGGGMI